METTLRGVGGPGAGLQDRGPLMGSASEGAGYRCSRAAPLLLYGIRSVDRSSQSYMSKHACK